MTDEMTGTGDRDGQMTHDRRCTDGQDSVSLESMFCCCVAVSCPMSALNTSTYTASAV
jgi:hypothetical protein